MQRTFYPGGSGGLDGNTALGMVDARVTAGNINLPNTSGVWTAVADIAELVLPAAVGDRVAVDFTCMRNASTNAYLEVAVQVDGALVRFMSSGGDTPAVEGDVGFHPQAAEFPRATCERRFVVTADDLEDDGAVHFAVAVKSSATGGVLNAGTAFPFYWTATNYGGPEPAA